MFLISYFRYGQSVERVVEGNREKNTSDVVFPYKVEAFCDVTLAVEGASLKCHKMVLAACSSYFQNLFMENTCKHPIVFLKVRALVVFQFCKN